MAIQLSICIPTYNREKYLKQLLDCIENQLQDIEKDIVEICVSDNASTDNTQSMMLEYQQKYNNITYFRWDKNMGADNNYLKVVEIAHGKYCWFFGSDDLMVDGAIKKILEEIKENCDIYLCDRYECDINMNILDKDSFFRKSIKEQIFVIDSYDKIKKYCLSIDGIGGLFSYLSSIVFIREKWNSITLDNSYIGTAYVHCYILMQMLKMNIKLKHINSYIVMFRTENDSFLIESMVKRIKLDYDGYKKLFVDIFANDKELIKYYKIILRKTHSQFFLATLYEKASIEDRKLLISFVKDYRNVVYIFFLSFVYYIYRKIFKNIFKKFNIHRKLLKILS